MSEQAPIYLRAGLNKGDPSEARFELLGISAILHVDSDGTATVYKEKTDGTPTAKPIAVGTFKASGMTSENAPDIVGIIETSKGSKFRLYGWTNHTDFDSFIVLRYDTLKRAGTLFQPK